MQEQIKISLWNDEQDQIIPFTRRNTSFLKGISLPSDLQTTKWIQI